MMTNLIAIFVFLLSVLIMGSLVQGQSPNTTWPPLPPYREKARMARYLAHYGDWGIIAALSPDFGNVPFGTLQSYCDGPIGNSTGTPYFYMASISDTYKNIKYNNSVSMIVSAASGPNCRQEDIDPESPVCARITLVGKVVAVTDHSERAFAKSSLFSRHPEMKTWPSSHDWQFYKMILTATNLLDFFGGATHVPIKDYYAAKP